MNMTKAKAAEILKGLDTPEINDPAINTNGHHIVQIWEDGEVTLTKGGPLYGHRNLHMIEEGIDKVLPLEVFPHQNAQHAYIICSYEDYPAKRQKVIDLINEGVGPQPA